MMVEHKAVADCGETKAMATHNEVAHNWAHQTGRKAKGYAMFYEGDTIYSHGHHFVIAKLIDLRARGYVCGTVVLFNKDRYSVSTSQHQRIVYRACQHMRIFTVRYMSDAPAAHEGNYDDYLERIKAALDRAKRARKYSASFMECAEGLIAEANSYVETFDLGKPMLTMATFGEAMTDLQARIEDQRREQDRLHKEQERKLRASQRVSLSQWVRGEPVAYAPWTPRPVVRVNGDQLQTTWGATVPLSAALAVYRVAKAVRAGKRAACSLPGDVGHYGKAHIDRRGNITVGCHNIPFLYARVAACRAGLDKYEMDELHA